jgi:hypothetical protein
MKFARQHDFADTQKKFDVQKEIKQLIQKNSRHLPDFLVMIQSFPTSWGHSQEAEAT